MLAFFLECACPPARRSITVGAGDKQTVEDFLADHSLTHIVCDACNSYYRLIGYIDESGAERRVSSEWPVQPGTPESGRRLRKRVRSRL